MYIFLLMQVVKREECLVNNKQNLLLIRHRFSPDKIIDLASRAKLGNQADFLFRDKSAEEFDDMGMVSSCQNIYFLLDTLQLDYVKLGFGIHFQQHLNLRAL